MAGTFRRAVARQAVMTELNDVAGLKVLSRGPGTLSGSVRPSERPATFELLNSQIRQRTTIYTLVDVITLKAVRWF